MARKRRTSERPAPRAPLTRESISRAALQLIDREGLDGLSMRQLGRAMGVEGMAIYHHFRDKGELLDGVMERLFEEVEVPPRGSLPPLERLRRMFGSYRGISIRHPKAFILLVNRRFNTERLFALYEQVLEALADHGLTPELSARYFRMFGYYMNGAGMAEIASRAAQPDATPVQLETFDRREQYPRIAAVAPHLRVAKLDAIYDFGLDMIFRELQKSAKA
ncbi:MAG TPA: TetR/AcrR family transcriptional regulator [Burkholderiales bacterium]|nr:TetR/AcrR family transcriptional regulator [Burkholderiales bacterium]